MTDIFDQHDNRSLVERLEKLTPGTIPLWGKMTAAQMVLHAQKPIDVALEKLMLKSGILSYLFGKMAKNGFIKKSRFQQEFTNSS